MTLHFKKRRSQAWFEKQDRNGFVHRSWAQKPGYLPDAFDGRPVIGICNTWSELTPCNSHFRELANFVKRGVLEAGGFPLEFPVMSLGETQLRPTAMLFRNLASMDVEESIRGNPIDGVVLLMGCDKTTPALLMGAASCGLPTIGVSGGPMLNGKFRGKDIGSGTGVWMMSEMVRGGDMIQLDVDERGLHLEVSDEELARRKNEWVAPDMPTRGYARLYVEHVQQAHLGADLDFLVGKSGAPVPRESH